MTQKQTHTKGEEDAVEVKTMEGLQADGMAYGNGVTLSVQNNAHSAISVLLAPGASFRPISFSGRTLFHEAAAHGNQEIFRLLTTAQMWGIDIKAKKFRRPYGMRLGSEARGCDS